jgi:hypothetical protein
LPCLVDGFSIGLERFDVGIFLRETEAAKLLEDVFGRGPVPPRSLDTVVTGDLNNVFFCKLAAQRFAQKITCSGVEKVLAGLTESGREGENRNGKDQPTDLHTAGILLMNS